MLGWIGGRRKRGWQDEMAGWHHWLNRREFEWTPGVGDGQGGLACCDSWGRKELDTTERLNWTDCIVWLLGLWVPSGTWTLIKPLTVAFCTDGPYSSPLSTPWMQLFFPRTTRPSDLITSLCVSSHMLPTRRPGWGLVFSKHFLSTGALSISLRNQDFGSQESIVFPLPQPCHISPWRPWAYSHNWVVWIEDTHNTLLNIPQLFCCHWFLKYCLK